MSLKAYEDFKLQENMFMLFISIKDKWNPYCSKWGYCISYDAHGANGPGQSKGAVEDGQRGQCRSNSDCTPHAPNCSPEGYCSQGVFLDIQSNAVKNDEYYGKIEDDNIKLNYKNV
jgi:hypothetical protein